MKKIHKRIILCLFMVMSSVPMMAQVGHQESAGAFLRLWAGRSMQNYQNLKAATYQLSGTGSEFGLGWGKESGRSIYNVEIAFNKVDMESSLSHWVEVNSTVLKINIDYLRCVGDGSFKWYCGMGVNSNINLLENSRLQNDKTTYNFLNTLMLRGAVRRNFKLMGRYIQGEMALGLGVVALCKDTKSFAFTMPQKFLEDGKFNYQGASEQSEGLFKCHSLMSIGKYRRINTGINCRVLPPKGKRHFWEVGYNWDYYSYEDVKNYRVTYGLHSISLSYNFMFHRKK